MNIEECIEEKRTLEGLVLTFLVELKSAASKEDNIEAAYWAKRYMDHFGIKVDRKGTIN